MSISTILNRISSAQREIQALQRQLTSVSSDEASKLGRIAKIKQSITKSTSISMLESKQRDILSLENEIAQSQKKQANLTKRISDKTVELHRYEQQLNTEREKEQKTLIESMQRREQEMERRQAQLVQQLRAESRGTDSSGEVAMAASPEPTYDAFISHASEDKEDLVRPLAEVLQKMGFSIWYDEFQLKVGDSLRRSIDKGLVHSRFGIVVLSPAFFAKNWPQYELDGLVAKEMGGRKVILPIWHKVSKNEVIGYSPSLADKLALNTAMYTIEELAEELGMVLRGA